MNLPDWIASLGLAGGGGLVVYLMQVALQWHKHEASTGLEIKKHRDRLTIEMLETARAEVAAARAEVHDLRNELEERERALDRLRDVEWRLTAFEEACGHVEALLTSDEHGGREAAENAARVFLARMEAMKLARGDAANAEQAKRARRKITKGDAE